MLKVGISWKLSVNVRCEEYCWSVSSLALLEAEGSPVQSWPGSGAVDVVVAACGAAASGLRAMRYFEEGGIRSG